MCFLGCAVLQWTASKDTIFWLGPTTQIKKSLIFFLKNMTIARKLLRFFLLKDLEKKQSQTIWYYIIICFLKKRQLLMLWISGIIFRQNACRNSFEHFLGENPQQLPSNIQRFKNSSVFVASLGNEILFKLGQKFQVQKVVRGQSLFTNHGLHGLNIFANCVTGVQLKFEIIS